MDKAAIYPFRVLTKSIIILNLQKKHPMVKKAFVILMIMFAATTGCNRYEKTMDKAKLLYEQGVVLRSQQLSERATQCFMQALELTRQCDNTPEKQALEGQLNDNLGSMFFKHSIFDEAFAAHQEALLCFAAVGDTTAMITAWRNSGRDASAMKNFDEAKRCFDTAFCLATLTDDQAMLGDLCLEMGRDYYMPVRSYDTAIILVNRAMSAGLTGNDLDIANMTLGILHYHKRDYETAKAHLNASLRSERAGLKMSAYQTLYAIAYNEHDYKKAVEYQDLFTKNMMQSDEEHDSDAIRQLKADFDLRRHEADLKAQQRQRRTRYWLVAAAALIALLVVALVVSRRMAANRLELEQLKNKQQHDQSRIRQLVAEMEELVQANDEMPHGNDQQPIDTEAVMQLLRHNKVYTTAMALSEKVTAGSFSIELADSDWDDFVSLTDMAFYGFTQRLARQFPKLGKWDMRICCLSKNGFSNQVISILLDMQLDSYYRRKTRIKHEKMNLGDDNRSFEEIINDI